MSESESERKARIINVVTAEAQEELNYDITETTNVDTPHSQKLANLVLVLAGIILLIEMTALSIEV